MLAQITPLQMSMRRDQKYEEGFIKKQDSSYFFFVNGRQNKSKRKRDEMIKTIKTGSWEKNIASMVGVSGIWPGATEIDGVFTGEVRRGTLVLKCTLFHLQSVFVTARQIRELRRETVGVFSSIRAWKGVCRVG